MQLATADRRTTVLERLEVASARRRFGWWFPIASFLALRLFNAILIAFASHDQVALDGSGPPGMFIHTEKIADPGYWSVITNWDGQWYQLIAEDGYPTADSSLDGNTSRWAWAFPPLFPIATRGVMTLTKMPFAQAATVLNVLAGAIGMVLLFRLLDRTGGRFLAVAGTLLVNTFMSAPLFQIAYSESLAFLLLMAIFVNLRARRYGLTVVLISILAFTRLISAPIAVVAAVILIQRWRHREHAPVKRSDLFGLLAVTVASVMGTLAWALVASAVTNGQTGASERIRAQAGLHLGWFSDTFHYFGVVGPIAVLLFGGFLLLLACSRNTREWGLELRTWLAVYPAFILLVTGLSGGIFRYLLLCPPYALSAVANGGASRTRRITSLTIGCAIGVLLQIIWIRHFLAVPQDHLMP